MIGRVSSLGSSPIKGLKLFQQPEAPGKKEGIWLERDDKLKRVQFLSKKNGLFYDSGLTYHGISFGSAGNYSIISNVVGKDDSFYYLVDSNNEYNFELNKYNLAKEELTLYAYYPGTKFKSSAHKIIRLYRDDIYMFETDRNNNLYIGKINISKNPDEEIEGQITYLYGVDEEAKRIIEIYNISEVINNKIYIFGATKSTDNKYPIYAFDITTNKLTELDFKTSTLVVEPRNIGNTIYYADSDFANLHKIVIGDTITETTCTSLDLIKPMHEESWDLAVACIPIKSQIFYVVFDQKLTPNTATLSLYDTKSDKLQLINTDFVTKEYDYGVSLFNCDNKICLRVQETNYINKLYCFDLYEDCVYIVIDNIFVNSGEDFKEFYDEAYVVENDKWASLKLEQGKED